MKFLPDFLRFTKPNLKINPEYHRWREHRSYAAASLGSRYSDFTTSPLGPLLSAPPMKLSQLRARARALQRDNEFASAGIHILASRLISRQGLQPRFMVDRGFTITESMIKRLRDTASLSEKIKLLLSEPRRTATERYEAMINALWADFAKHADFLGKHSFDELVKISILSMITNGESLVRKLIVDNKELAVPLQLQLIEADLINDNDDNFTDRIHGINVTSDANRPVSIRVYTHNPNGVSFDGDSIDIRMEDIVHLKEDFRPGQLRGVSWLATIMLTLRDLGKAQSSELSRQAVASLFVGVIQGGDKDRMPGATERSDGSGIIDAKMSPATFYHTKEGETVTFSNPSASTGFDTFTKINLERIAAGLRIPYYALSGDYKNVNFSTSRMAENKSFDILNPIRQTILVNNLLGKITRWFIEAIKLKGIPDFNLKSVIPPMIPSVVDAQKENAVTIKELDNGLISWSEAVRKVGRDPDLVQKQILEDNEFFVKNNISFSIYNQQAQVEVDDDDKKPDIEEDDDKKPDIEEDDDKKSGTIDN